MYLVKYTKKGNSIYKRGFIELSAAIKYLDDIKKGLVGQKVDIGRYEQKIRIYTLYEVMDIYLDKMKKSEAICLILLKRTPHTVSSLHGEKKKFKMAQISRCPQLPLKSSFF